MSEFISKREMAETLLKIKEARRVNQAGLEDSLGASDVIAEVFADRKARKQDLREMLGYASSMIELLIEILEGERMLGDSVTELALILTRNGGSCLAEEFTRIASISSETKADERLVYFARATSGDIKIGVSANPAARITSLNASTPMGVVLLATEPGGLTREKELHDRFAAHRFKGEWFRPDPELLSYIADLGEDSPAVARNRS